MTAPDTQIVTRLTCSRSGCDQPIGRRVVVLLHPRDGADGRWCGPYCEADTDALMAIMIPTYTGGGPAYRIEVTP